jgi:hypothetical protein
MARILFLLAMFWAGFTLLSQGGWEVLRIDERMAWAMVLPGAYLLGLVILRD